MFPTDRIRTAGISSVPEECVMAMLVAVIYYDGRRSSLKNGMACVLRQQAQNGSFLDVWKLQDGGKVSVNPDLH